MKAGETGKGKINNPCIFFLKNLLSSLIPFRIYSIINLSYGEDLDYEYKHFFFLF